MWNSLSATYHGAVDAIIRPPRDLYAIEDLGPKKFRSGSMVWHRKDLDLQNDRGQTLKCSHFLPTQISSHRESWPCVVYLHGNSSSRVEAMAALEVVLPLPCTLFALDFSGSGHSDGEYVSLGYFEKDDYARTSTGPRPAIFKQLQLIYVGLKKVIEYLRSTGYIGSIGLWGRSMGAVTALLHADRDQTLACLVLDSPFTRLRTLCQELVENGEYLGLKAGLITSMIVDGVLHFLKGTVREKAGFEIDDLQPIENVPRSFVPAYFIAGANDNFIPPKHSEELWKAYAGEDKIFDLIEGADHNSGRPRSYQRKIAEFLRAALQNRETGSMIQYKQPRAAQTPGGEADSYSNPGGNSPPPVVFPSDPGSAPGLRGRGILGNGTLAPARRQPDFSSSTIAAQQQHPESLPPSFREVESRSRPGTIVYEDIETRRRYGSLQQAWRAFTFKDGEVAAAGSPGAGTTASTTIMGSGSPGVGSVPQEDPNSSPTDGTKQMRPSDPVPQTTVTAGGATSSSTFAASRKNEDDDDIADSLPLNRREGYRQPLAANAANVPTSSANAVSTAGGAGDTTTAGGGPPPGPGPPPRGQPPLTRIDLPDEPSSAPPPPNKASAQLQSRGAVHDRKISSDRSSFLSTTGTGAVGTNAGEKINVTSMADFVQDVVDPSSDDRGEKQQAASSASSTRGGGRKSNRHRAPGGEQQEEQKVGSSTSSSSKSMPSSSDQDEALLPSVEQFAPMYDDEAYEDHQMGGGASNGPGAGEWKLTELLELGFPEPLCQQALELNLSFEEAVDHCVGKAGREEEDRGGGG